MVAFHHKTNHSPHFAFEEFINHFADVLANTILGKRRRKICLSKNKQEAWRISEKIGLFYLKQKTYETYDERVSIFLQAS